MKRQEAEQRRNSVTQHKARQWKNASIPARLDNNKFSGMLVNLSTPIVYTFPESRNDVRTDSNAYQTFLNSFYISCALVQIFKSHNIEFGCCLRVWAFTVILYHVPELQDNATDNMYIDDPPTKGAMLSLALPVQAPVFRASIFSIPHAFGSRCVLYLLPVILQV